MKLNKGVWLTSLFIAAAMAGCSGGGSTQQPNKEAEKPSAKKDPIELVFYSTSGDFDEKGFMEMYGNKIKEKFPHITPVFITYNAQDASLDKLITAGQRIDILYNSIGQTAMSLQQYQMEVDISDLIKKYNYDLTVLEPSAVEMQRQIANGGIYGLPVNTTTLSLFYNKEIFDRFGVPYPKESMSWEQLMDLTRKLSREDGGKKYTGLGISNSHFLMLTPYSAPYVDPKTNRAMFTKEPFVKTFETLIGAFKIPGNELDKNTVSYTKLLEKWEKDKTVAMFMALSGLHSRWTQSGLNWDYAPMPTFSDKKGIGPQNYPTFFYITKMAKDKDQAFEVISYLTSEEMQTHLARKGLIPVLNNSKLLSEIGKDASFLTGKQVSAILPSKFADPAIKMKYQTVAQTEVIKAFNDVILGNKDVNTALRDADEAANKAIDAAK
ncbi:ABC transporter substrate-binding protein [Paenibacillus allorhizosphaerae]|uniref:Extracellular solute-binding protein n=1 Tax=Paenibacillus allorhizosphaerae TaxID=2849866 RepID=A0ABN7TVF5_9BACL|nr:extracellular solute-binding protein [Paenibacillus allorhizosphaerae]CAG7653695.1 hypothetical protein PAECIP111802_05564 [Paenibacillus allorhizosphaerae]